MNEVSVLKTETNVEMCSVARKIKRKIYLITKRIFDILVSLLYYHQYS